MKINSKALAYCGIYCPECSFMVAFETGKREHVDCLPDKYQSLKEMDLAEYECPGCKEDNKCGDCKIKACASSKDFEHCAECDDFPCKIVLNFYNDGIPHHENALANLENVRTNGIEAFIILKEKQSKCSCGEALSWYLEKCPGCGEVI